jgi:hypothetical protein
MSGRMISELNSATTLQNTDLFPLARGATTLKITGSTLVAGVSGLVRDSLLSGGVATKSDLDALSAAIENGSTAYATVVPSNRGGAGSVYGILKADGLGNVESALANIDYVFPGTLNDYASLNYVDEMSAYADRKFIAKPETASGGQVLTYDEPTQTWQATTVASVNTSMYAPLSGATFTGAVTGTTATFTSNLNVDGNLHLLTVTETLLSATAASSLSLNLSAATFFRVPLTASITTLTFENTPASPLVYSFMLQTIGDGTARSIAWPASVKWPNNTPPTITTANGKSDIFTFLTYNQGTIWYGFTAAQNQ